MRKAGKYIKRILVIGICLILSISIVPVRKNVKATQGETPQPDIDILIDLDKDGTYETNIEDVDNLSPGTYNLCIKLVNNGETALSEPWNGVHIQVWKDYVGNADSAGLIQSVDMGDFYTGDMWVGPDWCSEQYISTPAYFKYTTAYPDGDTDPDPIFRDPFCGSQISRNEAHGFELNIEGDFSNPAYAYFTVDFSEQATYYICYRAWLDDVDDTIYNPYYNEYSTYVARDPYDVPYSRHHFWYDTDASEGGDEIFDFGEYNCYTKEIVVETVPSSVTGKIVYASDESGNYDIWLMDLATGAKVQLTDEEYDETLPYWSPNGNKIAYLLKKSDYEHEIWVMDADGSNKQKIATIASGGQLVCTIMGGWLDDNNLVFSKVDGSVCHHILYKVDLNGNVQSILDPNDIGEGEIWFADYNPITKKLVFEAQSGCWDPTMDIYVADYDVATNTISNIVLLFSSENHYDGRPRISPDGQKVVFVHRVAEGAYNPPPEYHDLWVVNIDGSDPHPITSNFGENYNMRPTFVDDDTIIFFAKKEGAYDLWMMDLDGSNPTKLTNTPYNETWPDFYPVSEIQNYELIFSEDFSGDLTEKWDLVIFNSAGGSDNDAPPTTRSDYGNPPPCFDNKGDSWCGNAIFSKQTFDYSNGLIIECDMWVKDARYEGCWVTPNFGIARELPGDGYYRGDGVYVDNDHCDPKYVVSVHYPVYGPACWADPDKQGHAGIWYKMYNESGEVESYFEFPADEGLEEWHTFKIYIRPDRHVEFYRDGELVYTTHSRISMDYNNMPLVLGGRSCEPYGPALHDNVKVYAPVTELIIIPYELEIGGEKIPVYLSNCYDSAIVREYYIMEREALISKLGINFVDLLTLIARSHNPLSALVSIIFDILIDVKVKAKHQEVVEFLQEHDLPVASDAYKKYYCWSEYFIVHPPGEETVSDAHYFGEFARTEKMFIDGKLITYLVNVHPDFLENLDIKEYTEAISPGLTQIDAIEDVDTLLILNAQKKKQIQLSLYKNYSASSTQTCIIGKILNIEVNNTQNINWPMNISIYYSREDLQDMNIDEFGLVGLAVWNETMGNWQLLSETGVNRTNIEINGKYYEGYVWGNVWHLSFFGLYALTPPCIEVIPIYCISSKNTETAFNITIDDLPNGLSGYNITVSLSNSSVAEIEAIEFPEWALLHQNSSLPSSSAWVKAVDLDDEVKEGERNVVLATITIKALNEGITSINIDVNKLDDDNGYPINVSIQDGILNVIGLQPLPGFENPPTDPDNDGLFEDLNGNGLIDFDDVVEYFKHFEWIENNYAVNFIDFNLNSRIDFDDVVELFKEV